MCKNILEFCLSPDLGGLELCVVDNFNYFTTQTDTFLMVAPKKKLDNFIDNSKKYTLKRNKLFPILPALKLAKFIDANDIDIVHFHWTRDVTTVVFAKILSKKKPKIMQSRHMRMTRFKDDFYHKWLYKNIDIIHAVTKQVQEQLIKFIPSDVRPKIEQVYLGVKEVNVDDAKLMMLRDRYKLDDSFIVGIVGRIEEGKGQYIVIEALSILKELNIKLLIVGNTMDKSYLASLKEKISVFGVNDKVIFTGFTKEVNEHIQLCDTTVLATPEETFGLVVIESMINKVPVIATNKGGPLEIIDDEEDGLLFDRSPEDLASKIKLIYNDAKLKKSLALCAYEKVKSKFNAEIEHERLFKILEGMK